MRLVDADALPVQEMRNSLGGIGYAVTKHDIDTAPTIRCEACEHYRPWSVQDKQQDSTCGMEVMTGYLDDNGNPPADFGCSYFKPKDGDA